MPIVYDIEPEEDDESKYRCWECGKLLEESNLSGLCHECWEAEQEEAS